MHAVFKENKIGIVQPVFGHIFVTKYYQKKYVIVIIFIQCNINIGCIAVKIIYVQISLIVQMLLHKCKVKTLGSSALKNHPSEISTPDRDT